MQRLECVGSTPMQTKREEKFILRGTSSRKSTFFFHKLGVFLSDAFSSFTHSLFWGLLSVDGGNTRQKEKIFRSQGEVFENIFVLHYIELSRSTNLGLGSRSHFFLLNNSVFVDLPSLFLLGLR